MKSTRLCSCVSSGCDVRLRRSGEPVTALLLEAQTYCSISARQLEQSWGTPSAQSLKQSEESFCQSTDGMSVKLRTGAKLCRDGASGFRN
jgi:hypothetical protein